MVVLIDELSDLMMVAPNDVEDSVVDASGTGSRHPHWWLRQRPSVDVITGN